MGLSVKLCPVGGLLEPADCIGSSESISVGENVGPSVVDLDGSLEGIFDES